MASYTVYCPCCGNEFDFYSMKEANQKEREIRRGIKRIVKNEAKKKARKIKTPRKP